MSPKRPAARGLRRPPTRSAPMATPLPKPVPAPRGATRPSPSRFSAPPVAWYQQTPLREPFQAHQSDYVTPPMTRSIWQSAWALLITANLFWAGNIVLARALAGHVPPVTLAYWRWTGAFI